MTITKERLLKIQHWRETYGADSNVMLPAEEAAELARIALASLEVAPVGEVSEKRRGLVMDGTVDLGGKSTYRIIKGEKAMKRLPLGTKFYIAPPAPVVDADPVVFTDERNLRHIAMGRETSLIWGKQNQEVGDIPLYRHAQPVPVVPDECPAKIRELMASHSDALFNDGDAQEIWNACRTAMLRGNHRDLSQPIGQQVAEYEKIMLQDENFPVTPDGWIKCSDRTPETGQAVIGCVDFDSDIVTPLVREFIWTGSTFRRGVSSTGVKSNDSIVVTHWMPLPAAPKKD
ncbi:DUF551 domain-containing protein [Salmonella enterica subsp. enterica]|nr:DUF551 domain-containing protein [Salmonella enterica subsp. enterica]